MKQHGGLPDFEAIKVAGPQTSTVATDELDRLKRIEEAARGWLHWYDSGGGAGRALNGIRAALNGEEEED